VKKKFAIGDFLNKLNINSNNSLRKNQTKEEEVQSESDSSSAGKIFVANVKINNNKQNEGLEDDMEKKYWELKSNKKKNNSVDDEPADIQSFPWNRLISLFLNDSKINNNKIIYYPRFYFFDCSPTNLSSFLSKLDIRGAQENTLHSYVSIHMNELIKNWENGKTKRV
jgi:hypothetical protein